MLNPLKLAIRRNFVVVNKIAKEKMKRGKTRCKVQEVTGLLMRDVNKSDKPLCDIHNIGNNVGNHKNYTMNSLNTIAIIVCVDLEIGLIT